MKVKLYNLVIYKDYWRDFDCGIEYPEKDAKKLVRELRKLGQNVRCLFVREEEQVTVTVKIPKP